MTTTTHPKCGKSWGGLRAEHCSACCETFSGTTAGDKHRDGPHSARVCLPPASVGLHQDERGVWRLPSSGPSDINDRQWWGKVTTHPDTFTATVPAAAAHARRNWERWDNYDPRDHEPSRGECEWDEADA